MASGPRAVRAIPTRASRSPLTRRISGGTTAAAPVISWMMGQQAHGTGCAVHAARATRRSRH